MNWTDRIGRRLKLNDLHVFITVVEMGSMSKAGERLAISQPSISKAIADIEHTVGVRLLDRTSTGVVPTAYGRALLKRSLHLLPEGAQPRCSALAQLAMHAPGASSSARGYAIWI